MDKGTREYIASLLEALAAEDEWNNEAYFRCVKVVEAHLEEDDLLAHVYDDLMHYSGRRLLQSSPNPKDHPDYRQEFRDVALALRENITFQQYRERFE